MFNAKKSDEFYDNLAQFPMFFAEPSRVNKFIEEETKLQRHQLGMTLSRSRIFVSLLALTIYCLTTFNHYQSVLVLLVIFYVLFVYGLMKLSDVHRDKAYLYNLLIATSEIALIGYLISVSGDKVPMSFLFFSVVLSAILLPLGHTLLTALLAISVICFKLLGMTHEVIKLLLKNEKGADTFWQAVWASEDSKTLAMLVVGMFFLAIIVNRLSYWSFKNDIKAQFRYKQMRQVLSFNRAVIEKLKTGVIIVADSGKILSINQRAILLLNIQTTHSITELTELSSQLAMRYLVWKDTGIVKPDPYRHNADAEETFITFDVFGEGEQGNITMLTIESVNDTQERIQEAKLAALGRLTAGVAHEIRNPLASINSATQLLAETTEEPSHQKLTQMILKNVKRTDQIISDILGLFKSTKASRELHPLAPTLRRFADEFSEIHQQGNFTMRVICGDNDDDTRQPPLFFLFDLGHFEQILWNLLQNSIKYAGVDDLQLTIRYGLSDSKNLIYVDVMDNGHGVADDKVNEIFEPFSTGGKGTGLGLYLVHELCSANNASITYSHRMTHESTDDGETNKRIAGACFRITTKAYFE